MSRLAHGLRAAAGNIGGFPFDLASLTYDSKFSPAANNLRHAIISPDGDLGAMVDSNLDSLRRLVISTNYDISTGTISGSTSVSSQSTSPWGLFIDSTGTRLYLGDGSSTNGYDIFQYSLSTPWDVTTASYIANKGYSEDIGNAPSEGISFSPDGLKMIISVNGLASYTLSTAWDITTASYDSNYITEATLGVSSTSGILISDDGTQIIICDNANGTAYLYNFGTPFDVTTLTSAGISFNFSSQVGVQLRSIWYLNEKVYAASGTNDRIFQYSI